jgi:hypothetical protein
MAAFTNDLANDLTEDLPNVMAHDTHDKNDQNDKHDFHPLMPEWITLQSGREDFRRHVSKRGAMLSRVLRVALETDADAPCVTLDLSAQVLGWVAEYMRHHQDGEPTRVEFPLRSRRMGDICVDPWDARFMDAVCARDVALAAHYLDMDVLLHLSCAKLATRFWKNAFP